MISPLQPIEKALEWVLKVEHQHLGLTYGWAIVVLTILVRAALLPLVIKQYRSMRQMQVIAPKVKELQRKYKDDRRKQQEEVMKLYSENNANPFASCLPMAAQLPVFFALYYVLRSFSKHINDGSDPSFMWLIPNITIHLKDLSVIALVIGLGVYGLSQLLSTELSFEPHTPNSQRRLMRLLPIPIVFTALQFPFPAGLGIYWVTTNLWTAGQMLVIKHIIGLHIAHPAEGAVAAKPTPAPSPSDAPRGRAKRPAAGTAALADGDVAATGPAEATGDVSTTAATPARRARPRAGGGQSNSPARKRRPPKKRR